MEENMGNMGQKKEKQEIFPVFLRTMENINLTNLKDERINLLSVYTYNKFFSSNNTNSVSPISFYN